MSKDSGVPVRKQIVIKIDATLSLTQDLNSRKKLYSARFRTPRGRYITKPLKTASQGLATHRAIEWRDDQLLRIRRQLPAEDLTFQQILDRWFSIMSETYVSLRRPKAVRRCWEVNLNDFLLEACNQTAGIDSKYIDISVQQLSQYSSWRTNRLRFPDGIAQTTLLNEIGCFNLVFRWAHKNKIIDTLKLFPKETARNRPMLRQSVRKSINSFSDMQIRLICKEFRYHYLQPHSIWNRGTCAVYQDTNTGHWKFKYDELGRVRSKGQSYLSRVNLYAAFYICLWSGCRLSELFSAKWKDISPHEIPIRNKIAKVLLWRVEETKFLKKRSDYGSTFRTVVLKESLIRILDRVKKQNPLYCSPDDYIINFNGKKRKTLQPLFEIVQRGRPKLTPDKSKSLYMRGWADFEPHTDEEGNIVDCEHCEHTGDDLDLRHLRSYYISRALIDRKIDAHTLARACGNSISTIMSYYLVHRPRDTEILKLAGWNTDEVLRRDDLELAQSFADERPYIEPPK